MPGVITYPFPYRTAELRTGLVVVVDDEPHTVRLVRPSRRRTHRIVVEFEGDHPNVVADPSHHWRVAVQTVPTIPRRPRLIPLDDYIPEPPLNWSSFNFVAGVT